MNDTVELLFQIKTAGQADVDKLAASVREVSGASALATDGIASLEKSIQVLTAAVTENSAALAGQEGSFDKATAGAQRFAGGARNVTSELRIMEGAMPIRAAAQLITQFEGLNTVMQLAFPIFGAIALVGVLDTILEKTGILPKEWDAVTEAQKESFKVMDQQSKKYDELLSKNRLLRLDEFERKNGKQARQLLEADEDQTRAGSVDHQQIETLRQQVEVLRKMADPFASGKAFVPNDQEAFLANMAGVGKTGMWGLSNTQAVPGVYNDALQQRAKDLLPEYESRLRTSAENQTHDTLSASDLRAKVGQEQQKEADAAAKKRKQELDEAERQAAAYLRQAQQYELTGLDKINEVYREKLALLGKTKKAIEDIGEAYRIEVERETKKEVEKGAQRLQKEHDWWMEHGTFDPGVGGFFMHTKTPTRLQFTGYGDAEYEQDRKDVDADLRILRAGDDSEAEAVRRRLGTTTKGNALGVGSGRVSGQAGATADYNARISAAREIFGIETQHLDLISEKDKREEQYASARKKRDQEIYRAAEQYENQLQALREKDLQKYQATAGSLFDALENHSVGQWLRGGVNSQLRQVFTNVAAPALQTVGHTLGGLIPGQDGSFLGTVLHGTVFDSKNKGVVDAETTAKQTTRTADEVHALRGDIRAMSGSAAPTDAADGGSGIVNGATGAARGRNPLSVFGSDINGLTGTSGLFNAGNGGSFGQFFSGLTGMGSNPLGAIFGGMSTNGSTVTQLTGLQRAGAVAGTAAGLFGAGMGIYSGIQDGGAGGITKAIGSGLGAAALLDPEPVSKAILGIGAAVSGVLSSLFGNSKDKREKQISEYISKNQYLAPTALNVIQGMDGNYEDFDARGNLRTSSMAALPTVLEPYITSKVINGQRQYYNSPGSAPVPYTGGATGTGQAPVGNNYNFYIQANDVQSFHDYVRTPANAHALGEAVADHLERHDGRLANSVRFITGRD